MSNKCVKIDKYFSLFLLLRANIMGLDMYLTGKIPIFSMSVHNQQLISECLEKVIPETKNFEMMTVEYQLAYWRKANAIHNWFVENIQEGKDECQKVDVTIDQLKKLLNVVNKVIENPELGPSLLPTKKGFFFGSYDYGECFMEDCKTTKIMIESIVNNDRFKSWSISYQSSW